MSELISSKVNRCSYPSELKITDLRFTDIVGAPMHCTLMKIYTNQGIVGLGEVRDGGNRVYAEMLKSRILGENPCNVEKLFRRVKQFGGPARGEVSAELRSPCGIWPERHMGCLYIRCLVGNTGIGSAAIVIQMWKENIPA